MSAAGSAPLFTIGHSNHELEAFVGLLQPHGVTLVADVRSEPYSRFCPQFNGDVLRAALPQQRLQYLFLGRELGARRSEPECYVDGVARYELIAKTPAFAAGLERVRTACRAERIALLCAEKDPLTCHRMILVCRQLRAPETNIQHILEDGTLEPMAAAEQRLLSLFNLEEPQLFQSREQLLDEAYQRQAQRIQFAEPGAAVGQPES